MYSLWEKQSGKKSLRISGGGYGVKSWDLLSQILIGCPAGANFFNTEIGSLGVTQRFSKKFSV